MEALKLKGIAHDGRLTIEVPEEFDEKELEVIVSLTTTPDTQESERKTQHVEKVKQLKSIIGAAKYPDFPITKYDVYEQ
jgi:hypothetical protein